MYFQNALMMAVNEQPVYMPLSMANRHGLITGATGTGKTVTVKVMAESFSDAGVPVFLSDIKGDLAGMSLPGQMSDSVLQRVEGYGLAQYGWQFKAYPTVYWDVFAKKGISVRATISEMGPLLLSRLMDLSAAQEGVLNIIFRIADDQGLLLLDLKDLRAVVQAVGDHAADYKTTYGNIAASSIGAIQRGLLKLETQGADQFFGEPALDITDWIRCDQYGRGVINVLNCEELFQKPDLYTAYLLWMLSELYETLPEVGDLEKPKMVFFFDEAHLLFKLKSKELMEKVEQVIRLIRSKGVGVYFITQNPADVPDSILSQLSNKIQHALRAYTPAEQKAVRAAAQSYVVNPSFKTEEVIPQLGKGEALVSFLNEKGIPVMVERAVILPPQSLMGTIDNQVMNSAILSSDMYPKYSQAFDRESAYELLNGILPAGATLQYAYAAAQAMTAADPMPAQGQVPVQMGGMSASAQSQYEAAISLGNSTPAFSSGPLQEAVFQNGSWICPNCSQENSGNFCGNCGAVKPASSNTYSGAAKPASSNPYSGPSLVAAVQAQQAAQAAQTQTYTQAQLEKMQKEAVKQAKAELKAEQEANKESDLVKTAKSIATSGARTAVNTLVRGALGGLMKKK